MLRRVLPAIVDDPYDGWGVATTWRDALGGQHRLARSTVNRLRDLVGEPGDGAASTVVLRRRQVAGLRGRLHLEDGGTVDLGGRHPRELPLGYHVLEEPAGSREVIVVPEVCVQPSQRMWGWAAQLYATRSHRSWGIGDLQDLADLGRAGRRHGAGFTMVNPLQAVFPAGVQQPSPYSPSTRRFLNPIYLDVETVPGAAAVGDELTVIAARARELNRSRLIDRDAVLALKLAALERIWEAGSGRRDPAFDDWRAQRGDLHEFAAWSTIVEHHGPRWSDWPPELRRPGTPAMRDFTERHADRVVFHCWLQWLLERQLDDATAQVGLVVDLPIGFDPHGFDAWTWQDELALGASVGAPPDELNTLGQDWGLPPFVPWRLRGAGYRPFVDTLRSVLRPPRAGQLSGIRIDHVLGLFRLWWVPSGHGPADGGYVRNHADDLLGILALESQRSGAVVVGEDLGTVPAEVPERLAGAGVLSYRVLWFEDGSARAWPAASLGSVSTHDLPTVAGLWSGDDLREQEDFDLQPNHQGMARMRERLAASAGLPPSASADQAIDAAHRLLAEAPSTLLTATLDDAAGETRRPNIPGATQRPNWCLALPMDLDQLVGSERAATIARRLQSNARRNAAPVEPGGVASARHRSSPSSGSGTAREV